MTIALTNSNPAQYPGNGVATQFVYPWKIFAASDLIVGFIVGGLYTQQLSGYTVAGVGNNGGGSISFSVAPPLNTTVDIRPLTPETQPTDFANIGTYLPENTTNAADRLTRALQDLARLTFTFGIHGPDQESTPWPTLPNAAARAGTALLFDQNGLPTIGVLQASAFTQALFNAFQLASPPYAITAQEIAAGVTPVNYVYRPGSFLRYGADPTGASDSHVAILAACSCNADVFDDYPGGGTYLLTSTVQLPSYPLTIRGQARWTGSSSGVLNGTKFVLSGSAPSGAAHFSSTSALYALRIQNIGFTWQTFNTGQIAIHTQNDLRYSIIEGCAFIGSGAAGTNVIGILCENASVFTGASMIRDNFFDTCGTCIWLKGACTTLKIYGNECYGYVGGSSSGNAIECDSPVTEVVFTSNYFEGWVNGIYSNGATNLTQVGNVYEVCTQGYNWVAPGGGVISNQSIGELGVAGVVSGYTTLDGSQIQVLGRLGSITTGGAVQSTRGFQEGTGSGTNLRTQLLGYGASPTVTMGANGSGVISAQTTTTWSISYVGGHIQVDFEVSATLTGATTSALQLPLPAAAGNAIVTTEVPCAVTNNGSTAFGLAYINSGTSTLLIGLGASGSGNFTAGTVGASGQIRIRIVS